MLPKANRLRRSRDFREAFAAGRSYSNDHLRLIVRRRDADSVRFGFVVSKKVGGAVERNRVKRLLRAACRETMGRWRPGTDAVFVARASLCGSRLASVSAAVGDLVRRAGLMPDAARGPGGVGE